MVSDAETRFDQGVIAPVYCRMTRMNLSTALSFVSLLLPVTVAAATQVPEFTDVPLAHPAYEAAMHAREAGIMLGNPDGSLKPDDLIDRASAIVVIQRITGIQVKAGSGSRFTDVADDAWYRGAVEAALVGNIIDGPPKTTVLNPSRTVTKVEFLKMLLQAKKVESTLLFSDISYPLSADVRDSSAWFYPHVRYGIATGLVSANTQNRLELSAPLTRGDIATMIFAFDAYVDGARSQTLLTSVESEITSMLKLIERKKYAALGDASARTMLLAAGAVAIEPENQLLRDSAAVALSFHSLSDAFAAGVDGNADVAAMAAGHAVKVSETYEDSSPAFTELAKHVQAIASRITAPVAKPQA